MNNRLNSSFFQTCFRLRSIPSFALVGFLTLSCGTEKLDPIHRVKDLRFLATVAEPPEQQVLLNTQVLQETLLALAARANGNAADLNNLISAGTLTAQRWAEICDSLAEEDELGKTELSFLTGVNIKPLAVDPRFPDNGANILYMREVNVCSAKRQSCFALKDGYKRELYKDEAKLSELEFKYYPRLITLLRAACEDPMLNLHGTPIRIEISLYDQMNTVWVRTVKTIYYFLPILLSGNTEEERKPNNNPNIAVINSKTLVHAETEEIDLEIELPLDFDSTKQLDISPQVSSSSYEMYQRPRVVINRDGSSKIIIDKLVECGVDGLSPNDEQPCGSFSDFDFYATNGSFEYNGIGGHPSLKSLGMGDKKGASWYSKKRPTKPVTIWVVAGDGRGGSDWAVVRLIPQSNQ